ncbi:MAG: hypothetical protein CMC81_01270 [Flavobacteriaceae bacterium]|nr:hypothetical protein [Flavobacteriaceae bacterium]
MKRKYFFSIYFLLTLNLKGQTTNPIKIPIKISGTFGEIRNTHFHSGVDIKTQGKQGINIFTVKDGIVKRIKVSKGSFGKAIYIEHNDGTTSVYAHLKKFSDKIEKFVKEIQYKNKSYEIEVYPSTDIFVLNAGTLIGFSGNTGSSTGPHLHFEIRDSKTNYPINPLKILNNVIDTLRPKINDIYLYNVNNDGSYDLLKKLKIKKVESDLIITDTIQNIGRLGIGINYFDKQDRSNSKNGAYSISLKINNKLIYNYKMDTISLFDKRYLQLFVDYKNWYINKNKIQKLFTHPKSKYTFIKKKFNGIINVEKNNVYNGLLEIEDFNGNKIRVKLIFEGKKIDSLKKYQNNHNVKSKYEYSFKSKNVKVEIKKNTFFDDINIPFDYSGDTLDLGKNLYPIDKKIKIIFDVKHLDSIKKQKSFISFINKKNKPEFIKTKKQNNIWSIETKKLGKYTLSFDTISPSINPLNFRNNQSIRKKKKLILKVFDDLSGIKKINGFINDKWVLFEHETKNNTISFDLSDLKINESDYRLKIIVSDYLENEKEYNAKIFRNK